MRGHRILAVAVALVAGAVVVLGASRALAESRDAMVRQIEAGEQLAADDRAQALHDAVFAARRRIAVTARYDIVRLAVETRQGVILTEALAEAQGSPGVVGGAVLDADGVVLARAGRVRTDLPTTVLAYRPVPDRSDAVVRAAARVAGERGETLGWLVQEFSMLGLVPHLARPLPYADGAISVVHRDGTVLLTTAPVAEPTIRAAGLRDLVRTGTAGSVTYESEGMGAQRVVSVAPVPDTRLALAAGADLAAASRPARALVWRLAALVALCLAALAVLVGLGVVLVVRGRRALVQQAETDELTGLGNRRSFDRAVGTLTGAPGGTAVVVVDLDRLKALNDGGGHAAGDEALQRTAAAIRTAVRPTDIVARVGGDEFVVLLPDTSVERGRSVARSIQDAVASVEIDGFGRLSASVGAAAGPNRHLADTVVQADLELYEAKRARPVEAVGS